MNDPHDKMALRARLRRLRRDLAAAQPEAAARAVSHMGAAPLAGDIVSLYQPMGSEMSPLGLSLLYGSRTLCLPVAAHRDQPLIFRRWTPESALAPDAFGIAAPLPGAQVVLPDIVFAPVLGFDAQGNRLGQGAGHYDRTLQALRALKPVVVIGLAYAGQEVDVLPAEPHDQRLDAILTETGYRAFV